MLGQFWLTKNAERFLVKLHLKSSTECLIFDFCNNFFLLLLYLKFYYLFYSISTIQLIHCGQYQESLDKVNKSLKSQLK